MQQLLPMVCKPDCFFRAKDWGSGIYVYLCVLALGTHLAEGIGVIGVPFSPLFASWGREPEGEGFDIVLSLRVQIKVKSKATGIKFDALIVLILKLTILTLKKRELSRIKLIDTESRSCGYQEVELTDCLRKVVAWLWQLTMESFSIFAKFNSTFSSKNPISNSDSNSRSH